jgi:hypothetical protein
MTPETWIVICIPFIPSMRERTCDGCLRSLIEVPSHDASYHGAMPWHAIRLPRPTRIESGLGGER